MGKKGTQTFLPLEETQEGFEFDVFPFAQLNTSFSFHNHLLVHLVNQLTTLKVCVWPNSDA